MVFIDKDYRTDLGTYFYDRLNDIEEFWKVIGDGLNIVIGPRNVGKSEFIKYLCWRENIPLILIDYRKRIVDKDFILFTESIRDLVKDTLSSILRYIIDNPLPGKILDTLFHTLRNVLMGYRETVIFFDEMHLIYGSKDHALYSIEALSKYILYSKPREVVVIASSSEGFLQTPGFWSRVVGYGVSDYLLEPLDYSSFKELHEEYVSRNSIIHPYDVDTLYHRLIGGSPGYLKEIYSLPYSIWVNNILRCIENAVENISFNMREPPNRVLSMIYDVIGSKIDPMEDHVRFRLAMDLVENNIVYLVRSNREYIVKPQLPVYRELLEYMLSGRRDLEKIFCE